MTIPPARRFYTSLVLFFVLLNLSFDRAEAQSAEAPDKHAVQVAMKNVMYHYTESVAAHIFQLQGELHPVKSGSIVVFDDKNSFDLAIASAEIAISCNSLAQ